MVRPILRARAILLSAMLGALAAPVAQAADMDPFVEAPPPIEGPVEWGSNWYLRGQVGAANYNLSSFDGMILPRGWPTNWTIGLGGGYRFNDWFRTDVTIDYQKLWERRGFGSAQICWQPFTFILPGVLVNTPSPTGCASTVDNRTESISFLANAYVDLGTWWGFTPYIGAGVGANLFLQRHNVLWSPVYFPYTNAFGTTGVSSDRFRFSYAGMAGVTYNVDDHWKIDLGYRWLNMGRVEGRDIYNNRISRDLLSHQLRLGFRYMID